MEHISVAIDDRGQFIVRSPLIEQIGACTAKVKTVLPTADILELESDPFSFTVVEDHIAGDLEVTSDSLPL